MSRGLGAIVAFAGAVALVAVVAWRLGASYTVDLAVICEAEGRSGISPGRDMAAVSEWTRGHLETADGNAFYAALAGLPVAQRARRLEAEATAWRVASCPLVAAYDGLVDAGRSRAEMQRLCSRVTFPDLVSVTGAERVDALASWIEVEATTLPARGLGAPLRAATTPADRARVLNAAAHSVDVLTCDAARALLAPDPSDAAPE